jgi:vanillate O-demethylase ferredoxin subunit
MRISQDWQAATVRRCMPLSPTVRELELVPDAGCTRPAPGSHLPVRLTAADGRTLTRQYSLLGRTDDGLAWRIAVKRCSPSRGGSAAMHALAEGDVVQVLPPQNRFELSVRAPQHLLVAGGIGITPILGMVQALVARGADVRLLYAVRGADELVYAGTLRALLGDRLHTFVSDQGQRLDIAAEVARLQPDAQLLLCGPAGLTRAAQAAWHAAGRPAHRLRFETFGAVATEAEPFWVDLPRHGLRFQVAADQTLLQALQAAGIDVPCDCGEGLCGTCEVGVLDGDADHRDKVLSKAERAANTRMMSCCSRARGQRITLAL